MEQQYNNDVERVLNGNSAEERGGIHANPLLAESDYPFGTLPLSEITPDDFREGIKKGIELHEKEIASISGNPDVPDFHNTIAALDRSGVMLTRSILALSNLDAALGDEKLMEVMSEVMPLISHHGTDILLDRKLWGRIKAVYENRDKLSGLSSEDMRLLEETYLSFARSGADLDDDKREIYRKLNSELSALTVRFSQNVTNDMKNPERRLWLSESQLGGLPDSIVKSARAEAAETLKNEGKEDDGSLYMFSMFMPSYSPFMKYSSERELRERLYRMSGNRNTGGDFDNTQILKDIANIRLEIAKLMGKENFAQYKLQHTMAATPERVMEFLGELKDAYKAPMKEELKTIEEYARRSEGDDFILMPWDYSYWFERMKNDLYSFNDEEMKPYFELENTISGVFGLAEKLYGYSFKENSEVPKYHPDVKVFEVYDSTERLIGILYADFFYRAGKSPGAWMTEFRTETKDDDGNRDLPLISIVCNFSKPVGDEPVLLTPGEVNTFLHEFGHALHGLSSEAEYESLSGTNVYHDFVELFSQFNENYLTEKEFLDGFARHYKTGESMPQSLIDSFIKASRFGAAYAGMRQLGFGYLDMAYHTIESPLRASGDISEFEKNAQAEVRCFEPVEGCLTSTSFGHIFSGGYAAGYYGYKWSEALDADAFAAFKEKGIFNREMAGKFLKMLQAGGTVDPEKLYEEFRGKKPTVEALLRRDGIIE